MKITDPSKQKPAKVPSNSGLTRAIKQVVKAMKPSKKGGK